MKIENRLRNLAATNPSYGLLLSQWEFDKKLLSRALNTVNRDFPHYSLHDATHSSTIINQIEKIISKDINKLSATDCWLILESCYWHDSGMLITDRDKSELLKSEEFKQYINGIKNSSSELNVYIEILDSKYSDGDHNSLYEKSRALTFILADYYRRQHAERSGTYVLDPQSIKILSPRTALIPSRLFFFVAEIVTCHGKNVESLMSIASCNDGMDSDDYAHPRYVAALLRIGDLLDIDDGRFCPTMLANIGDVPPSSYHHQAKHSSIRHIHIDSNTIGIKASCPDYDSFEAQNIWFDYLKSEIRFQKEKWNEISPGEGFSNLPVITELTCSIDGFLDIDGKVPKIKLYNQRVYEYLSSSFLYSEKFPYLRESIQNSVDSIYYKVWNEFQNDCGWTEKSEDVDRYKFIEKLRNYDVKVNLRRQEVGENTISYILEIIDLGLGINLENIKKILKVGSPLNEKLSSIRSNMPDWAKPSGFFGLGMQSIFKMSKSSEINTKSEEGDEYTILTSLGDYSDVKVKIKKSFSRSKVGTTIKIFFDFVKVPASISHSQIEYLEAYDPIKDDVLEVLPSIFENIIAENFNRSFVPIYFNNKLINTNITVDKLESKDRKSNYTYGIDHHLFVDINERFRSKFSFKGVPFEANISIDGISGEYDLFSKDASHWLTIDRKKINGLNKDELAKNLEELVYQEYEVIIKNTDIKEEAEFYFYSLFNIEACINWTDFMINGEKLKNYISGDLPLIITNLHDNGTVTNDLTEIGTWRLKSRLLGMALKKIKCSFKISLIGSVEYMLHSRKSTYENFRVELINNKLGESFVDVEIVKNWIKNNETHGCARSTVPLFHQQYKDISLNEEEIEPWMFCHNDFRRWFSSVLLLPAKDSNIDVDLEEIYKFYSRKKKTLIDKTLFIDTYKNLWTEIGVID